jgi:hypothetical protein
MSGCRAVANRGAGAPTKGAIPGRIWLAGSTHRTLPREAKIPRRGGSSVR